VNTSTTIARLTAGERLSLFAAQTSGGGTLDTEPAFSPAATLAIGWIGP
jgi:hypothetical protein